jgi:hypothetical protein
MQVTVYRTAFVVLKILVRATHSHIHSFIDHIYIYINVCMDTTGCGIQQVVLSILQGHKGIDGRFEH